MNNQPQALVNDKERPVLVGVVLDALDLENRFIAMKQLYDIAQKIINGDNSDHSGEFTAAECGIVCKLPAYNTEMFAGYDFDILFEKNANFKTHPASITKIISLITGLDWISNIHTEWVTIHSSDIERGSGSVYYEGDTMPMESILFAMMIESSNTCSNAFARVCGEKMLGCNIMHTDEEYKTEFIKRMNLKAKELGMSNSYFDTPHGLCKTNIITVRDMLSATIEACRFPQILRAWRFVPSRTIHIYGNNERDVLLERYIAPSVLTDSYYVLGGKTGSLRYDIFHANALVMIGCAKT